MNKEEWESGLKFIEDIFDLHEISSSTACFNGYWEIYGSSEITVGDPIVIHLEIPSRSIFYNITFRNKGRKGIFIDFHKHVTISDDPSFTLHRWTLHEAAIATAHIINDEDNCQHCTADFLDYTK